MRHTALAALFFPLFNFAFVVAAHGSEPLKGYVYDEHGKDRVGDLHNLAIVIDVIDPWVSIQSKDSARAGSREGDFGSPYQDCGNSEFHCLTGPLEIIIPKNMSMKQWIYHGLTCQSVPLASSDIYRITCKSPRYRGQPSYTYSISRGVLSIESSPIAGAHRYDLRGQLGLFSLRYSP